MATAVLSAFSVRPRWRLTGLALVAIVWAIGTGLWGQLPWPGSFEVRTAALLAAGLLAVFGRRFPYVFPAVLLLWLGGAWGDSAFLSLADAARGLHRLLVVACAGVGLAAFARLVALAWNAASFGSGDAEHRDAGWKGVSVATGLLLVALFLTLVGELTYRVEPLGLQPPLGLLVAMAEAVSGICLWRATATTGRLEGTQASLQRGSTAVGWTTTVGLMLVFVLTGLAFTLIPILAAAN